MIIHTHWYSGRAPVIIVRFWLNLKCLDRYSKKNSNIRFHENPCSGSRLAAFGQTDMMKPTVAFHNVLKGPKRRGQMQPPKSNILLQISWHYDHNLSGVGGREREGGEGGPEIFIHVIFENM